MGQCGKGREWSGRVVKRALVDMYIGDSLEGDEDHFHVYAILLPRGCIQIINYLDTLFPFPIFISYFLVPR